MAENLITPAELAVWSGRTEAQVEADDLAVDVMRRVSDFARFLAFHPLPEAEYGWQTRAETPIDAKIVILKVCRRSYQNPSELTQEGSVGPLGGDSYRKEAALGLELTEQERRTFTKYNAAGDPDPNNDNTLWVQPIDAGEVTLDEAILYVGDNLQVNLSTSADPREWKIPLFNPGDPGDPSLYPDEV